MLQLCQNGTRLAGHYGGVSKEGGSISGTLKGTLDGSIATGVPPRSQGSVVLRRDPWLQGTGRKDIGKERSHSS